MLTMPSSPGPAGAGETRYSAEGARIARSCEEESRGILDSFEKENLLDAGLDEIRKSPLTTLDEKMIAQFGKDMGIRGRDDYFDLASQMKGVAISAIGSAMPGPMGSVIMGIADAAAQKSAVPGDRESIDAAGSNILSFHRGLSILARQGTSSPEVMALKEMGAEMLHHLSEDGMDPATQKRLPGARQGNGEITEKAAVMLEQAMAAVTPADFGSTAAALGRDIAREDMERITRSYVLGEALSTINFSPLSAPAEKAVALFSTTTTVDMFDGDLACQVSAAMADYLAGKVPRHIHSALAEAAERAAGVCPDPRDQRFVLSSALEKLAKNDRALPEARKLAREGLDADNSLRDHGQAVDAMIKILDQVKGIETPEDKALEMKKELAGMAGTLSNPGPGDGAVEIAEGFIEIDGIRIPRNQL